jgi:hypothetical protein
MRDQNNVCISTSKTIQRTEIPNSRMDMSSLENADFMELGTVENS